MQYLAMDEIFNFPINSPIQFLISSSASLEVLAFFIAWIGIWLPIAIPLAKKLQWNPTQPLTEEQKLPMLASLYLVAPAIAAGAIWLKGTSLSDYGLRLQPQILISLSFGLGLSLLGLAIVFFLESQLGWLEWHREHLHRLWPLLLPILGLGLGISIVEEFIFRGWLLTELEQDYSLGVAAILSSLIFALLHLVWERQKTLPQIPGLILMGLVLVGARFADDGSLGLAWGLHAGWIWGLTCLDSTQLIAYSDRSFPWIVGFGGQPLAGMMGILCLLATGASLLLF